MKTTIFFTGVLLFGSLATTPAMAFQAGLGRIDVAGVTAQAPTMPVALFYPTQAAEREIEMGPLKVQVAMQAEPQPTVKGLIVLSHGTGGSELGHASLAQALARSGYLVAAPRHAGDNWQDRSMLTSSSLRYFDERPRQLSRVIDAVLNDPKWKDRIAGDAQGPRIGALGHSAGGYTVLALVGGQPDLSLIQAHCQSERTQDPVFCSIGQSAPPPPSARQEALKDERVRAVVALSPVGAVISARSLASISAPTRVYVADRDTFLVPRFHAEWIARHLPGVDLRRVANASHFAFTDTPTRSIQTEDGDIAADPAGFDRAAFLKRLGEETVEFFDKTLR